MNSFSPKSNDRSEIELSRKYPRHKTSLPITATILDQKGYVTVQGRCVEIAEGGLGAMLSADIASGEIVALEFSIPSLPKPLALRAVVRRRTGLSYGLEFVSLANEQRASIREFCKDLPPA
jgi:hypothetical protein